jgi:hypothetical protein
MSRTFSELRALFVFTVAVAGALCVAYNPSSGSGGSTGGKGSSGGSSCGCSAACCSAQASASSTTESGGLTCPGGTYCYGSYYCDLADGGGCTATDPCNGQGGTYTACGSTTGSSSSGGNSGSSSSGGGGGTSGMATGPVGPQGGSIPTLLFAVVGDTRPQKEGDTATYPTALITEIFSNIQSTSPLPQFVIATGDYAYCSDTDCAAQTANYITAATAPNFTNQVFLAMGNHECNGDTDSNCAPDNYESVSGPTANYTNFFNMLGTFGVNSTTQPTLATGNPYYEVDVSSSDSTNPWTARFVMIAANAWDSGQSTWLTNVMKTTGFTYTFVVRHESYQDDGEATSDQPGDQGASDTIIDQYPYTMLLVGHSHEYLHTTSGNGQVELIVGNGGAETSGPAGYVICSQLSGGNISCQPYASGTTPATNGPAVVVNPAGALQ